MDSIADFWADAEIISAYSRANALRDGVLIEVPGTWDKNWESECQSL
jgi:hypothetical protein